MHNWYYHVIASIEEYGAINGFTMEIYESLHKDSVKKPYRASNKRNATDQMIKTVSIHYAQFSDALHISLMYSYIKHCYRFTAAQ